MIRNTMFALSLLAFTSASAFAAPKVVATHHSTTVAQSEAGAAPSTDKPAKKEKKAKKAKKESAPKADKAPEAK